MGTDRTIQLQRVRVEPATSSTAKSLFTADTTDERATVKLSIKAIYCTLKSQSEMPHSPHNFLSEDT